MVKGDWRVLIYFDQRGSIKPSRRQPRKMDGARKYRKKENGPRDAEARETTSRQLRSALAVDNDILLFNELRVTWTCDFLFGRNDLYFEM